MFLAFLKKPTPRGGVFFKKQETQGHQKFEFFQMENRRKRRHCDVDDRLEQVLREMRKVQSITGCATSTLNLVLQHLQPFLEGLQHVKKLQMPRVRSRVQSRFKRRLHGCVGCHNHVFGPDCKDRVCPGCGHSRYDVKGVPNEVCWYFPLREQIREMIKIPSFRNLLMYERQHRRTRGSACSPFMSDIYDSPRWQKVAGPQGDRLTRVVLHGCVDGCPAYGRMQTGSVKPFQYWIANLPPWLRYKLRYMLIHVLIPAALKGREAKKYYDWLGTGMTDLFVNGVDGVRVIVYGTTLDTPGRRELLNMQAVTAFYPCPHCLHTWQPGLRQQVYGGYRRYLALDSPWRNRQFRFNGHLYQFRDQESRPPPELRNDRNVAIFCTRATPRRPFLGHKGHNFLHTWAGVDWDGNTCDKMHDYKLLCEMSLKGLVGDLSLQGMYKQWRTKNKDARHREDCKAYNIFPEFHSSPDSSPPWRLSRDELEMCDRRVNSMWWPHYMDPLAFNKHSFWTHSDRMWKCCHKAYAFLVILPTCLHGCVPQVHTSLLMLITGLRRLEGQPYCAHEAAQRGFTPGWCGLIFSFSAV